MNAVNNNGRQLRVLAVHDISCIGKCSLTVALPVISAAGIETAILPTAVLSTHTGGFKNYTYRDLTDDIVPIVNHWVSEAITFDAIYMGYLGSTHQIDIMKKIISLYKPEGTTVIIDPVMADNGSLYATFDEDYPRYMADLCRYADIITPNITEAVLMLGEEYVPGPYNNEYIEGLLIRLGNICRGKIVLTGVHFDSKHIGAAVYDAATGFVEYAMGKKLPGFYHGTGDVFASSLTAALMLGKPLEKAAQIAVDYTAMSIAATKVSKSERCYGVNFEAALPQLIDMLSE